MLRSLARGLMLIVAANAVTADVRCRRIERVDVYPVTESSADLEMTYATWTAMPGARERLETERMRLTVHHDAKGWPLFAFVPAEERVAEELIASRSAGTRAPALEAATPVAAARAAALRAGAGAPALQTTKLVRLLAQRAVELTNQSRLEVAAEVLAIAEGLARELGDAGSESLVRGARSVHTAVSKSDLPATHQLALEAVALAEQSGDPEILGRGLLRLQSALERRGIDERAGVFARLLALEPYIEDASILALGAASEARRLSGARQHRAAFRVSALALRFADRSTNAAARFNAAFNLGHSYLRQGDHEIALAYLRKALDVARKAGFASAAALALQNIAHCNLKLRRPEEALCAVDEALELARQHGSENAAELLGARAFIHTALGNYDAADADLRRAAQKNPPDEATRYKLLVALSSLRGHQRRHEEVLDIMRERAALAVPASWRDRVFLSEAQALRETGRADEALALLRGLIDELEHDREAVTADRRQRSMFHEGISSYYAALIEILVFCGNADEALRVAEQFKGRLLDETTRQRMTGARAELTEREQQENDDLDRRLRTLNAHLLQPSLAQEEITRLRQQLAEVRLAMLDFNARSDVALATPVAGRTPWYETQQWPEALRDTVVINYIVTDNRTFVFVARSDAHGTRHVEVRPVPIQRRHLSDLAARFVGSIERRNLGWGEQSRTLYDLLIKPVEHHLAGARSLCIIPDDQLWRVPFHALRDASGKSLVEHRPLFYAPSIQAVAAVPAAQRPRAVDVLTFANPRPSAAGRAQYRAVFRDLSLASLPDAESEVEAIAAIYGRERTRVHIGNDAQESTLKRAAGTCRILHVATHGIVDEAAPMFSSLLFAGGSPGDAEDGLLEVREIADLRMDADLAVLSACETGRGDIRRGEGVIGLAWSFLAAGCRGAVVSQWKTDSKATAKLMIAFHRRLAGGHSASEALRLAQLELKKEQRYRDPLYWASFIVVGTGSSIASR
jgi:CHAT domain-containing protein